MIYLNDHIEDFDLEEALTRLSPQRREQALRYKHEHGRRQSVAAYLLLCEGLREEYGITEPPVFGYHDGGKPFIEGRPDIFFNLSHCREAAVCVIAPHPVGIDVESVRQFKEDLARYTMNEHEMEQILISERPDIAFIRLWTMKEALLKMTGEGIRNDLKNLLAEHTDVCFHTIVSPDNRYVYTVASRLDGIC